MVTLLPGLLAIGAGVVLIVVVAARPGRRAPLLEGAGEAAGAELGSGELVLPDDVAVEDLNVRITRSCVCVYAGSGPSIRLRAVWRWSGWRRALVAYDRRQPEWSPEWSRVLAESAWANR